MPSTSTTFLGRIVDEAGNLLLQPPVGGMGQVYQHGARTAKRIALTYDDGPNAPSTLEILDILAAYQVKATFFCVGVNSLNHPQIVRRAYAEGHVIGNHSMHHSRKAGLMPHESAHIDDCTETLTELLGVQPRLYRAPWGWLTPWETRRLTQRGFSLIGWDVYTYDWQIPYPDGAEIAAQIVRDSRPGSIILLHDGIAGVETAEKPQTTRATEQTIVRLRAAGYEFVTIPELLGIEPYVEAHEHHPTRTNPNAV